MGLLDDAIREHLELKRRRGADSSEVARQEQEAFGPPRRGDLDPEGHAALDEPATFAAPRSLQAVEDVPWEDEDEPVEAATQIHAPVVREPVLEPELEPEPVSAVEPEPEPEPEAPHASPSARSLAEDDAQPTREFDAQELRAATEPRRAEPRRAEPAVEPQRIHPEEPEVAPPPPASSHAEDEPEDDDVLEETPEFLQETPEHDRLWFEQRPPKDFDF